MVLAWREAPITAMDFGRRIGSRECGIRNKIA
jgi:hypothetical protein